MRLIIAIKAFFAALMNRQKAQQIERLLTAPATSTDNLPAPKAPEQPQSAEQAQPHQRPARDPAITLLATLQREARLVDLIQEDLSQYSDAQVGAAARPCLQQCAAVLSRLFDLQPVVAAAEGDAVQVASDASPMQYQWIGEGTGQTGKLVHHGWRAEKVELPKWAGEGADANVVAPAQVQSS